MVFNENSSDEELMQAYQNGADGAFDLLFSRYSTRVYGFLMNRLKKRDQADDVFQATFLKLHQSRERYDRNFPFAPWLFTVCKSVLVDHARKHLRNREDANEQILSETADEKTIEPASTVALESLPANQRTAIELRYQDNLPFEEIAAKLQTSPANVRQLVSRGLQKLRHFGGRTGGKS